MMPNVTNSYDGTCENGFDSEFGLRTIILHEILVRGFDIDYKVKVTKYSQTQK